MALTITPVSNNVVGAQRLNVINVAFDDSYPTGGEAITPADMGMRARIDAVVPMASSPYIVEFDTAASKLVAYTALGTEVTDTGNLTSLSVNVIAIGE